MKTSKTNFKFLMMLIAVLSLTVACDGEDGMDGLNGLNGVDGAQGPAGVDGTDGNANIIASDWISLPDSFDSTPARLVSAAFNDINITPEVENSSAILAFGSTPGNTTLPIPFTRINERYFFSISGADNQIIFTGQVIDQTQLETFDFFTRVRYVIIPSNNATTGKSSSQSILDKLKKDSIDTNNYYQVMDYFGLDY